MKSARFGCFFRIVSLLLAFLFLCPTFVSAAEDGVMPAASLYLEAYNAYVCPMGGGELQLWFNAMGVGIVDELGCLRISLYESTDNVNFNWVKSFTHDKYDNMLSYNDNFHASYVTYQGVVGRYYKMYVCIWGGRDGQGDTRYFWTSSDRAT